LLKHLSKDYKSVWGKRFTGFYDLFTARDLEKEKRWLGRLEPERKTDIKELFWKFYSSDG
jgi:hypothetical protein